MEILFYLAALGAGLLVLALRGSAARRRHERARATGELRCRAVLYRSGRGRTGRLEVQDSHVVWRSRRQVVDLTGAAAGGVVASPRERRARPDDVALGVVLRDGSAARLLLHESDAAALVTVLRKAPPRGAETPGGTVAAGHGGAGRSRPWWVTGCVLLAVGWLAGWSWLTVLGGERVSATVLEGTEPGLCRVTWVTGAGRPGSAEVDCADEPPGARRAVWAHPWPLDGDGSDYAWTNWSVGLVAAGLLAAGAVGAVGAVRGRAPRWDVAGWDVSGTVAPPPGPLDRDVLQRREEPAGPLLERLAPYAAAQLPGHGWEDPRAPFGAREPYGARQALRALAWPVAGLGLVAALTAPAPYRALVLATSDTAVATAAATGEVAVDGVGPVPGEVTVVLALPSGRTQRADLAVLRELAKGTRVRVRYAVDRPQWARLDGDGDGLPRVVALAGAGSALAVALAAWRLLGVRAGRRAVAKARQGRTRPVLALLTADPEQEPALLVADEALVPARLLVVPLLTPLPRGAARRLAPGPVRAVASGRLAEGEAVLVRLPGVGGELLPAGPAWEPDNEDLADLLDSSGALARAYDEVPPDASATGR